MNRVLPKNGGGSVAEGDAVVAVGGSAAVAHVVVAHQRGSVLHVVAVHPGLDVAQRHVGFPQPHLVDSAHPGRAREVAKRKVAGGCDRGAAHRQRGVDILHVVGAGGRLEGDHLVLHSVTAALKLVHLVNAVHEHVSGVVWHDGDADVVPLIAAESGGGDLGADVDVVVEELAQAVAQLLETDGIAELVARVALAVAFGQRIKVADRAKVGGGHVGARGSAGGVHPGGHGEPFLRQHRRRHVYIQSTGGTVELQHVVVDLDLEAPHFGGLHIVERRVDRRALGGGQLVVALEADGVDALLVLLGSEAVVHVEGVAAGAPEGAI
mmetsp:Transcript_8775/g.15792  ORF Transcript_8775/g.15792 Transcript_8775/m.15792 type:complete len:323 (+) Transcript_8775:569-1537(+)